MFNRSWIVSLKQAIIRTNKPSPRIAVVGIGQELRGDDAVGIIIVRRLQALSNAALLIIDAGPAPENFAGRLLSFAPAVVLLVDALQMDEPPGTIRLVEMDAAQRCSVTTHTLSSHLLADYLRATLHCDALLLGIQPGQDAFGAELSAAVAQSVEQIVQALQSICG